MSACKHMSESLYSDSKPQMIFPQDEMRYKHCE